MIVLGGLAACASESELEPIQPATLLAMRYVPVDGARADTTDGQIALVQVRTASKSEVRSMLDLATLMMKKRRETSAPIFMTYARDAVEHALKLEPRNPRALLLRGMAEQDGHQFKRAVDTARTAIALAPNNPSAYLLLGDAQLELGQYDAAVAAYQSAMDLRPDLRAYNRAAHMSWLHGQTEAAIQLLEWALDAGSGRDPESSAWCFIDLGEIYRQQGDTRRAIAAADLALTRVEDYVPALTLRARAYRDAGELQSSLVDYRAVLGRLPTVDTLVETADLLERTGDVRGAARRRRQARVLSQTDPRPFAHDLARRGVEAAEALRLAEVELRHRQGIWAWDTYALTLIRVGRLDDAQAALDRAQALGGARADFVLHRALLALSRGRRAKARASLAAAKAINANVEPRLVDEIEHSLQRSL